MGSVKRKNRLATDQHRGKIEASMYRLVSMRVHCPQHLKTVHLTPSACTRQFSASPPSVGGLETVPSVVGPSVVGLAWDLETTGFGRKSEIVQLSVTVAAGADATGQSFSQYVM